MTGHIALAAVGYAALLDSVVETFIHGSPVRWWVAGITALDVLFTTLCWRRTSWRERSVMSLLVVTAMLGVTAWLPGGLTNGVRLASLSTSTLLHLASAAGVALAAIQIGRWHRAPIAARLAAVVVALYSVAAFVVAIVRGDAFATIFTSGSFWRALPFVLQGASLALFLLIPVGVVVVAAQSGLRVPAGTFRREAHAAVALISVLVMLVATFRPGNNVVATGQRPAGRTLAAPTDVDNALRALADARSDFRRERWDPDFVADRLGADPAQLFRWVRGNTFWIPYRGVLRGPIGVLMDRQGNNLDRSLLLAALLGRSGREVRLAHAELSREQAVSRIAHVLGDAPLPASPDEPLAEPQDDVRSIAGTYQLEPDGVARALAASAQALMATYAELDARVADQRERLLAIVPTPRVLEFGRRFEAALAAMRDHWWLQLKDADRWVDFDLLENATGMAPAPPSATYDPRNLPPSLYHDVSIRIVAVQQAPDVSRTQIIVDHTFRPLDVIARPMALQLYPLRWPRESPPADNPGFEALVLEQEAWGAAIYAGNDVVATGTLNARGERESGGGGPMGGLGSAIANSYRNPTELTALSIEYVIRSPGRSARTIRRPLFDFTDRGGRALDDSAKIQRALALMTRTEILPTAWELAPDYVADQAVQALAANRERLLAAALLEANPAVDPPQPDKPSAEASVSPLMLLALARFEWSRVGHLVFHDRPNVFSRHQQITKDADKFVLRTVTDIVANELGVDLAADNGFAVRLEQGVMDTNAESLLQFGTPLPGNTADAFVSATDWMTVTSRDHLGATGLAGLAARLATQDLEAGHVLVTPRRGPAQEVSPVGWWRVDPSTGDTLGIGASGAGEASGLIVALQSAGETGVHYNILMTMAEGFVYQEAFCRAAPLPFIAMRAAWRMYINNLAPPEIRNSGLVVAMQLQGSAWDDIKSSATGSTKLCLFATMAAGILVTLPLVMMTMRFAMMGRVAAVAAEEGAARAAASGGRPPRFGRGPARPAPSRGTGPEPAPGPEPGTPGGSPGSPGKTPPRPDECPPEFGRGRSDDGFGNYPPNTPGGGPLPDPALPPDPYVDPYLRSAAEDAAWLEDLRADIAAAQKAFDEALAQYRAAAEKVEALKGKPDMQATLEEQIAEQNLNRTRWDLIKAQQRAARAEQINPVAQGLRDARAAAEEAMKADPSWETIGEQWKRLQAAKAKYLEAYDKKLSDFPADPRPSAPSGAGPDLPSLPPPPDGGQCGAASSSGGATGAAETQPDLGATQPDLRATEPDPRVTQPDLGATLPGGRPGPTYAPVRGGPPAPAAPTRTLVGIGGMLGGGS